MAAQNLRGVAFCIFPLHPRASYAIILWYDIQEGETIA